jgi:L-ribulose-5-phosphate 3-epimerase
MRQPFDRRTFLRTAVGGLVLGNWGLNHLAGAADAGRQQPNFKISLAEWSFHRALRAGDMDNLDFAKTAREGFGIDGIEYVNQFFKDKARDEKYLDELNKRASDYGVTQVLIMCDGEGELGDPDPAKRKQAVQNHHKWVDAARKLGCHSIRVNAASRGTYDEQLERAAEGLASLTEYGEKHKINVIVENHGRLSSNGKWLTSVIKKVNSKWCGTLPDFGNFGDYDRYQGVTEMMPFAKGVSAKSHDFDDEGNETHTDYVRMMKIVLDAGYHNWVGIEYEGSKLDEHAGVLATKKLLERVRAQLS